MIAACPYCGESIRIPESVNDSAHVACPLCQSQYRLEEVISTLPPALIVVDPPSVQPPSGFDDLDLELEPITSDTDGPTTSLPELQTQPTGSGASDGPTGPSFDFDASSQAPSGASQGAYRSASSYRPRGRQRNAVSEFIKIALGGLAGLVIAQGVLWWLPGTWRRDPLGLAPKLPPAIAFLAPEQLRPNAVPAREPPDAQPPPRGADDATASNIDLQSAFETAQANGQPQEQGTKLSDNIGSAAGADDLDGGMPPPTSPRLSQVPDLTPNSPVEPPPDEPSDSTRTSQPGTAIVEAEDDSVDALLGIREAPAYSSDELSQALLAVQEANQAWKEAESADTSGDFKAATLQWFGALYGLAWKTTFADPRDPKVKELGDEVDRFLMEQSHDAMTLKWVGKAAVSWLNATNRATDGVVLAGTVRSVASEGLYYVTKVELPDDQGTTVTAVTRTSPTENRSRPYDVGDRILLLGGIIPEPSVNIIGYPGSEAAVIWSGRWIRLPEKGRRRSDTLEPP